MVVVFDQETADADCAQTGARGVLLDVDADVGGVDDLGESHERTVARESVLVDQGLERALLCPDTTAGVRELRTGGIKRVTPHARRDLEHLVGRDEEELRFGIDEPTNQSRTGDAIRLRSCSGHPLHGPSSLTRFEGCVVSGVPFALEANERCAHPHSAMS